jgi:hypothetical protein
MIPFVLFCKSFRTDLYRVQRLAQSIQKFNIDKIPFYISVPLKDVEIFKNQLNKYELHIISDEQIIEKNRNIKSDTLLDLPGHIAQQIIKSEFWRLGISKSYMCLDSDAIFIRDFAQKDYLWKDAIPFTIMDEGHEFLERALSVGKQNIIDTFFEEANRVKNQFNRTGRSYSFGPFPVLWHSDVWRSLDEEYLQPNSINLMDAIRNIPVESHWYGEALLRYQAIPLISCQPLFKVYHYAWQLDQERRSGVSPEKLSKLYSGVIFQSAWEREMDWPNEGGGFFSRVGRRVRRKLGRI